MSFLPPFRLVVPAPEGTAGPSLSIPSRFGDRQITRPGPLQLQRVGVAGNNPIQGPSARNGGGPSDRVSSPSLIWRAPPTALPLASVPFLPGPFAFTPAPLRPLVPLRSLSLPPPALCPPTAPSAPMPPRAPAFGNEWRSGPPSGPVPGPAYLEYLT